MKNSYLFKGGIYLLAENYDYMSYDNFISFNEAYHGKMEYYNGDIICMSPVHPKHNKVQNKLYFQLVMSLNDCSKCDVYTSDVAVKFEQADEKYQFEPDVMICCDDKFDKSVYVGVPKLVIEVLSKTTQSRDLGIKLNIYEKYGVEQYWIVDINNQEIRVYSDNVNGRFKSMIAYLVDDQLIWNNSKLNLHEIFK